MGCQVKPPIMGVRMGGVDIHRDLLMRGSSDGQIAIFSYVSLEDRIPRNHPIRKVKQILDKALAEMDELFDSLYASKGRASIPPEQLLRALMLQVLYSIRSERQLVERLSYDMLFRWFVGLNLDEEVWHATTFTHNRNRLITSEIVDELFGLIKQQAASKKLLSKDHFSVDGTLLEASASLKGFVPKDAANEPPDDNGPAGRNDDVNFHGQKRSNETHASKSDPDSRLARKGKGKEAKLSYCGHLMTENRHGIIVDAEVTQATGTAEREAALAMLERRRGKSPITLGGDKNYDARAFNEACRENNCTPHFACRANSSLDGRTTRHEGYGISQRARKRIEECNGWMKDIALLRKLRHRGLDRIKPMYVLGAIGYNIVRFCNIEEFWVDAIA